MKHTSFTLQAHKPLSVVSILTAVSLFSSCYQAEDYDENSKQSTEIPFSFDAVGVEKASLTRALTAPTSLLIVDVCDGKTTTKELSSLDDVSLSLDYGTHELYFVAATTKWSSYNTSELTVEWSSSDLRSMKCVWGYHLSLTVDLNTEQQDIELPLVVGLLKVSSLDKCPSDAASAAINAPQLCHGLDLKTMQGYHIENAEETETFTIPSDYAGKQLSFGIYSLVPSSGSIGDVSITPYTSSNQEINCVTLNEVSLTAGYISNYSGYLFTNGIASSFSYTTDWLGTNEYRF